MIERLGIKASDGDEDRKREKSERKRISGCIIHFIHRECVEHSLGYRSLSLTLCLALTHTHTHTDWKNSLGTQTPDKTLKVYTNASPHPFQTHRPTQSPTHSCVHLVKQWAGTNSKYLCRRIFFFSIMKSVIHLYLFFVRWVRWHGGCLMSHLYLYLSVLHVLFSLSYQSCWCVICN